MSPFVVTILQMIIAGLPQIEAAVAALVKMADGKQLTTDELHALGQAMQAAHARAQGEAPTA